MADKDSLEGLDDTTVRELAALSRDLANDPATRKSYLKLLKQKNPSLVVPELDMEASMQSFAEPHLRKVAALEQEILRGKLEQRIESKRSELRKSGYSDDDVTAIEKMMVEKHIPSHDTAAEFFKLQKQSAPPTPASIRPMTLPVDKKTIKEAGGIKRWSLAEAYKAADEIKAGRIKFH